MHLIGPVANLCLLLNGLTQTVEARKALNSSSLNNFKLKLDGSDKTKHVHLTFRRHISTLRTHVLWGIFDE